MCIRDSNYGFEFTSDGERRYHGEITMLGMSVQGVQVELHRICLLYTSDAADERSSVDLGGRRIIKKKNREERESKTVINNIHI